MVLLIVLILVLMTLIGMVGYWKFFGNKNNTQKTEADGSVNLTEEEARKTNIFCMDKTTKYVLGHIIRHEENCSVCICREDGNFVCKFDAAGCGK